MTEWKDIASAPRDGTRILLVDAEDTPLADREVCVGWWNLGEWRDYGDLGCNGQEDFAPTHWMPLPEPPGAQPRPAQSPAGAVHWREQVRLSVLARLKEMQEDAIAYSHEELAREAAEIIPSPEYRSPAGAVTEEMVKRAANAILNEIGSANGAPLVKNPLDMLKAQSRESLLRQARAALEAARGAGEPRFSHEQV